MASRACLLLPAAAAAAAAWPDCTTESMQRNGTYDAAGFGNFTWNGTMIYVAYPVGKAEAKWPTVVYMHGMTGTWPMYQPNMIRLVTHGFVVAFPFVKDPEKDKKKTTTDMNGVHQRVAVAFVKSWLAQDPSSPLVGKVDVDNVAIAGHSMGASATIMSAYKLPAGSVKVAVSQHPGLCGPIGPPPWPSTYMMPQLAEANQKFPIFMTTATNDHAFRKAPETAEHELACFDGGVNGTALFAQFSNASCTEDGTRAPFDDSGHNCPFKVPGPENPWVLTALKLYTQLDADTTTSCYSMLFGSGTESLRNAPTVDVARILP